MIKRIFVIGLSIIIFSCNTKTINEVNSFEFETYSEVVEKIPEIGERIYNLVKDDYNIINAIMIESNPVLSPVIDNNLYSFFGESEEGAQVYMFIDKANNNILIGYYNATNKKIYVFEELKGLTSNGEFDRWVIGE